MPVTGYHAARGTTEAICWPGWVPDPEGREVAEAIAARSPNQWEITDTNPEETP